MTLTEEQKNLTIQFMTLFCLEVQRDGKRLDEHFFTLFHFPTQPYVASCHLCGDFLNWTVSRGSRGVFFRTILPYELLIFEDDDEKLEELFTFFGLHRWTPQMCVPPRRQVQRWRSTTHAPQISKQHLLDKGYRLVIANEPGTPFFEIYKQPGVEDEAHVVFSRKSTRGPFPKVMLDGCEVNLGAFAICPYVKIVRYSITEFGSIFENAPREEEEEDATITA